MDSLRLVSFGILILFFVATVQGIEKLKLWYIEENDAFEFHSERFGNYLVGDGLINNAPYYVNEDTEHFSIWKDDKGNWCNGLSSEASLAKCALYSPSKDLCSSNWFYKNRNNKWRKAFNGVVIQCQSAFGACPEEEVDYHGIDLPNMPFYNVDSWQKCGEKCQKEGQCMYWSYMPSIGNCWLKSSKGTSIGKNPREDRISGPRECPKIECTTTSGKSCIFPFEYYGTTHTSCTTDGNEYGNTEQWCSTKVDDSGTHIVNQGNWGNCDCEEATCGC